MSLTIDPKITVDLIKKGYLTGSNAQREINNLIAEFTSGIYTLRQMGIRNFKELERLGNQKKLKKSTH